MYLKKLTIQGFKSFANRTTLEFGRGVTSVVGPNGSGKSNVSDAIRWVLGEQSGRLLRARKQEDVIFAGSGERTPVGMAEVILTLDNEDGWLPLDFAEIELGRRLYRDGNTEYLLNGSRVRLRDIIELLIQGEVGQNSYTIMGQGLVDEVLLMSADERRNFVDEAADVRRFRVRVKEAQDRLTATRTNLDHVQLILSEIEPRLKQLGRQAERASEHTRLAAELADLLQAYYSESWSDTQNKLTRARAALDQRAAETLESEQKVQSLDSQLQTLGEEIKKRREVLANRSNQNTQADEATALAERAQALDRDRLEMLATRTTELESEIKGLQTELDSMSAPELAPSEDLATTEKIAAAQARLAECRRNLEEAEQASASTRSRLNELESGAAADEKAERRFADQARAANADLANLDRAEQRAAGARSAILANLKAYGTRFQEARTALRSAEANVDAARLTAEQARERLTAAEKEQGSAARVDQSELREVERLEGRLEALQRIQAELNGVAVGTRNALGLGQPPQSLEGDFDDTPPEVQGVIGLLAQQLKVPAGLETAINAALESRLHAIVVEHEVEALRLINLLQQRQAGRATILPLDGVRHVYPLNLSKEKGLVGVAAKMIQCDERLRPLMDTLLGRVIIVDSTEAGMRTVKRGLGTVVTLQGTLIEPSGVLTGGATGAEEGPLLRQRELEELPERIGEMRRRTSDKTAQIESAETSIGQATRESHQASTEYEAVLRRVGDARTSVERERERLNRIRRDMATAQAQRDDIQRKREAAFESIASHQRSAEELAERRSTLVVERTARVEQAQEAREQRDTALAAFSDANSELAAAEGEQKAAQLMREQHQRTLQRLSSQLSVKQNQRGELEKDAAAIEERLITREKELEVLKLERESRVDDSEPVRDELSRLEAHERQVSEDLQAARADLLRLERTRLDLETEVQRQSEHLETLRTEMARENLAADRTGRIVAAHGPTPSDAEHSLQGGAAIDLEETRSLLEELRKQIRRLGPVNEEAPEDFQELHERHEFLSGQVVDLTEAELQLREVIDELNQEIKKRFGAAFERVNESFGEYFTAFFGGGTAQLVLTNPDDLSETGVDIEAQPPGKKIRSLSLLSGGERSLTAVALLFALLTVNPAPFCVLDEVDAALDEANVTRFTAALDKLATNTQFLIVTHNRRTIEKADAIYGISMGRDSVSKVLSVRLDDITEEGTVSTRKSK